MLYMVVEHFKEGAAPKIYEHFREKGRMIPGGLKYISSWIDHDFKICYQLMQTKNFALFDQWIDNWRDLMHFEIVPVRTSAEVREQLNSGERRPPACCVRRPAERSFVFSEPRALLNIRPRNPRIRGQPSCSAMLEPTHVLSLLKSTPIIFPWLMRTRLFTSAGSPFSGQINIIRISAFEYGPSVVGTKAA